MSLKRGLFVGVVAVVVACEPPEPIEPGVGVLAIDADDGRDVCPGLCLLDFGGVLTGERESVRLTLSNVGDDDLDLDIVATDDADGAFDVDGAGDVVLVPFGEGVDVDVGFTPADIGVVGGTLLLGDLPVVMRGVGINLDCAPSVSVSLATRNGDAVATPPLFTVGDVVGLAIRTTPCEPSRTITSVVVHALSPRGADIVTTNDSFVVDEAGVWGVGVDATDVGGAVGGASLSFQVVRRARVTIQRFNGTAALHIRRSDAAYCSDGDCFDDDGTGVVCSADFDNSVFAGFYDGTLADGEFDVAVVARRDEIASVAISDEFGGAFELSQELRSGELWQAYRVLVAQGVAGIAVVDVVEPGPASCAP